MLHLEAQVTNNRQIHVTIVWAIAKVSQWPTPGSQVNRLLRTLKPSDPVEQQSSPVLLSMTNQQGTVTVHQQYQHPSSWRTLLDLRILLSLHLSLSQEYTRYCGSSSSLAQSLHSNHN